VIYGDDNASMLRDPGGIAARSHVGTPPEGSSVRRTSIEPALWATGAPSPGDCSHAIP
jgi:hypothetical protein